MGQRYLDTTRAGRNSNNLRIYSMMIMEVTVCLIDYLFYRGYFSKSRELIMVCKKIKGKLIVFLQKLMRSSGNLTSKIWTSLAWRVVSYLLITPCILPWMILSFKHNRYYPTQHPSSPTIRRHVRELILLDT